jgi:hypothetical protein
VTRRKEVLSFAISTEMLSQSGFTSLWDCENRTNESASAMREVNEQDLNALPVFPEETEDAPAVAQLPDRAKTWGSIGFFVGAVLGALFSVGIAIEAWLSGNSSLSETLAFGEF